MEHDPCYLYLGAINTRMGVFIGCGYGSETGIAASTLDHLLLDKNYQFL
jgi:hypothetical protein